MKKSIQLRDRAKARRMVAKRYRKREDLSNKLIKRLKSRFNPIPRKVIVDDLYNFKSTYEGTHSTQNLP